jgi:hypothetical protein
MSISITLEQAVAVILESIEYTYNIDGGTITAFLLSTLLSDDELDELGHIQGLKEEVEYLRIINHMNIVEGIDKTYSLKMTYFTNRELIALNKLLMCRNNHYIMNIYIDFTLGPKTSNHISDILINIKNLRYLTFVGFGIKNDAAAYNLARGLSQINIYSLNITLLYQHTYIKYIFNILFNNSNILNLKMDTITDDEFKLIVDYLTIYKSSMIGLSLHSDITEKNIPNIVNLVTSKNVVLRKLIIHSNKINMNGSNVVSNIIKYNKILEQVYIGNVSYNSLINKRNNRRRSETLYGIISGQYMKSYKRYRIRSALSLQSYYL